MYLDVYTLIAITIALFSSCLVMVLSIVAHRKLLIEVIELRKKVNKPRSISLS